LIVVQLSEHFGDPFYPQFSASAFAFATACELESCARRLTGARPFLHPALNVVFEQQMQDCQRALQLIGLLPYSRMCADRKNSYSELPCHSLVFRRIIP